MSCAWSAGQRPLTVRTVNAGFEKPTGARLVEQRERLSDLLDLLVGELSCLRHGSWSLRGRSSLMLTCENVRTTDKAGLEPSCTFG